MYLYTLFRVLLAKNTNILRCFIINFAILGKKPSIKRLQSTAVPSIFPWTKPESDNPLKEMKELLNGTVQDPKLKKVVGKI